MPQHFDILVIGNGLVGAAAAKYLSQGSQQVAIIGAAEPEASASALVYASHYDQARVQRLVGKDEVWTRLNVESARQYAAIQEQSGIQFHHGSGCLYVNPYGEDDYLQQYPAAATRFNVSHGPVGLVANGNGAFGGLVFPPQAVGLLESGPAGYINPRRLIQAQTALFRQHGGSVFSDTVVRVSGATRGLFVVETILGNTYTATRVLVATGSFINHFGILPQKLRLLTKSEVVLLVKIEGEALAHYQALPSVLYEVDEDEIEGLYMTPPVLYPDGNHYLKLGANSPHDRFFDTVEQLQAWFRDGQSAPYAPALRRALNRLLPALPLANSLTKKCVISRTATGRPYIGETATQGLFVAGGCNGYSAMCSDAMGAVAAQRILEGKLPDEYPHDAFRIAYDDKK